MNTQRQTSGLPLSRIASFTWKTGQIIALIVTLVVVAGLFLLPDLTLKVVWFAVVPLLPASFLINAGLWRGVCPLATANMLPQRSTGGTLTGKWIQYAAILGMVLLVVLIPFRRVLLNQNGPALAITLLLIVVLALVLGFVVQAKGGFCNSICPVLPVEKLYGQSPLLAVRNPRCVPCTLCTSKGCMDVDPAISVRHAVASSGKPSNLMATPFGLFAAAFPGVIYGYFQLEDGGFQQIGDIYTTVLLYGVTSLVLISAFTLLFKISTMRVTPVLGALSVGMYYWFAAPASLQAFDLPGGEIARWAMLIFVAFWLARALVAGNQKTSNGHKVHVKESPVEGPLTASAGK